MKIRYFAYLRTRVGHAEEEVRPPPEVRTVAALIAWLRAQSAAHDQALREPAVVRVAVNQDYAGPEAPVGPDDEVAFFPPVTGGVRAPGGAP